ncbi:hypothetical protein BH10PSE10_BH10PSE10_14760 [soil metagenome]
MQLGLKNIAAARDPFVAFTHFWAEADGIFSMP